MTKAVQLSRAARIEYLDAVAWYRARGSAIGADFVSATGEAFARVAAMPQAGLVVPGIPEERPLRRILLRRFPYYVVYRERASTIRILAVAHTSRKAGYWRGRA